MISTFLGYGTLIRAYVQFLLSKLRFHRHHAEFNGLFEYEEYVSLRGIDDPNEGYARLPSGQGFPFALVAYILTM